MDSLSEHPHVRGENATFARSAASGIGTSPRAWGKQAVKTWIEQAGRNIPTCVGKTRGRARRQGRRPEHPHVRGENTYPPPLCRPLRGTSPRAWGKRPREGGGSPPHGTSPRAWGKPHLPLGRGFDMRNIPTCVGKTVRDLVSLTLNPEHPHVRGENQIGANPIVGLLGTSPRAWGKRTQGFRALLRVRNIPTCVGKTWRRVDEIFSTTEHPHVRGENALGISLTVLIGGTSPRAWGKLDKYSFNPR